MAQNNDRRQNNEDGGLLNGAGEAAGTAGGAVAGAAVGSLIGPIGTIAGAVAGGALGNRMVGNNDNDAEEREEDK